jgi:hypothetical protein
MKHCDLRDLTPTNKTKQNILPSFSNANLQKFSLEGVLFFFVVCYYWQNLVAEFFF